MAQLTRPCNDDISLQQIKCQREHIFNPLKIEKQDLERWYDLERVMFEEAKRKFEVSQNKYRIGIQQIEFKRMNLESTLQKQENRYNLHKHHSFNEISKALSIALNSKYDDIVTYKDVEYVLAKRFLDGDFGMWGSDELTMWCNNYLDVSNVLNIDGLNIV